jgi:type II secretory pathway predicted ATPase ExeA/ankyrin repeat protein
MYTSHFGFREQPFSVTSDPRFFYTNPTYREAYTGILSALRDRQGFIVLTGEPGTGKTTLIRKILQSLPDTVHTVSFHHTTLTFEEMLTSICMDLHIPVENADRFAKVQALWDFLFAGQQQGNAEVLFIDEAQNLSKECLDRLQILLNLETEKGSLLSLILAGQRELEEKLTQPELRHIQQRIERHYRLIPLDGEEVGPFIAHRLQTVGCTRQDLFAPEAIHGIARYSQGIPRLINVICDNVLMVTYVTGQTTASLAVVEQVAVNLRLNATPAVAPTKAPVRQKAVDKVDWQSPPAFLNLWPQRLAWGGFVLFLLAFVFVTQDFSLWRNRQRTLSLSTPAQPLQVPAREGVSPSPLLPQTPPLATSSNAAPLPPTQPPSEENNPSAYPAFAVSAPLPALASPQPTAPRKTRPLAAQQPPPEIVKVVARYTPDRSETSSHRGERRQQPSPEPVTTNQQQRDEARDQLARMGIPVTKQSFLTNAEEGNARIVALLLTAGISPNVADSQGWTALMLAVRDNHVSIVHPLLAFGASINAKNKTGGTALMMAAINNHPSMVRTLIDHGANINARNNQGWTALMYAAWKGHRTIVEALLDKGANARLTDKDGWTALKYAIWQSKTATDATRLNTDTPSWLSDNNEETIQLATHQDYDEIVELLEHASAKR